MATKYNGKIYESAHTLVGEKWKCLYDIFFVAASTAKKKDREINKLRI